MCFEALNIEPHMKENSQSGPPHIAIDSCGCPNYRHPNAAALSHGLQFFVDKSGLETRNDEAQRSYKFFLIVAVDWLKLLALFVFLISPL